MNQVLQEEQQHYRQYIFYLQTMLQINDETMLIPAYLQQFRQKLNDFDYSHTSDDYYIKLADLAISFGKVDLSKCTEEQLTSFIQKNFETLTTKLGDYRFVQEQKKGQNKSLLKALIKRLMQVFSANKKYHLALKTLKAIFKIKQNILFYPQQKLSPLKGISALPRQRDDKQIMISDFYRQCVQYLKQQFSSHVKETWSMKIQEIIQLVDFLCNLQKHRQKKTYMGSVLQAYFSQYLALLQSGRETLLTFANYEKIIQLSNSFDKSLQIVIKNEQKQKIIPALCKSLLAQTSKHRLAALQVLNRQCRRIYDSNMYTEHQRTIQVLLKNEIFNLILNKDFTQEESEESQFIFKFFPKQSKKFDKADFLIKLLIEKENKQKWFVIFCLKEINVYSLQPEPRSRILKYLQDLPNLSSCYPQYSQCIDDLLYKQEYYQTSQQRLFILMNKLMNEAYFSLSQHYQRKLIHHFKMAMKCLRSIISKLKDKDSKVNYLKQYAKSLLRNIHHVSIIIFNIVFEESQIKNLYGNYDFQGIMNFIIEELNIFDKVFTSLQSEKNSQDFCKEIVKLIKFVSAKCSVKVDVTDKYIMTLAKFPQIYQALIANEGYSKIKDQMEKILELFRVQPNLPFHILKTTFLKANYKHFSQYLKKPNFLKNKLQENVLKYPPKQLEWYQQLISLLQQTINAKLRQQIAQFLVLLHANHCQFDAHNDLNRIKYMNSIIEYFYQNTKGYRAKKASKSSVLANFEFIMQMMHVTDILGVGSYKPHSSLVATSTISLTILNNATFGDDVNKSIKKNFPVNMVLFDLLAIVGQSFKCGPEDLVLRQGQRFIPIIYNGRVLEDLNFTNQQIIAQKNELNFTKTPQLYKKGDKKQEISDIYLSCIKQIFNRFAYEGKMGQIECMNYLRQVGDTYISSSDRKLKEIMQDYDKDNDSILTFEDFLAYNIKKMGGHYASTYYFQQFKKGLFNLRYRKNITLYTEPLDISSHYNQMMRCRLSSENNFYEELFQYCQDQDIQIAAKARQILLYLPTYSPMREKAFELASVTENSDFSIFYKLILIQDQLNSQPVGLTRQENKIIKRDKIAQFITKKSNQIVFQLMIKYYSKINQSTFFYKCFTLCLKILRSLIDIDNLIETKIENLSYQQGTIHTLPHTTFFAVEILKALQAKNSINFEVLLVLQLTQSSIDLKPIIESCFNDDQEIRKACCNFVYLWQSKTSWRDNLFDVNITEKNMIEWFDLLIVIIQKTDRFDLNQVLFNTINILQQRQQNLYNRYDKLMFGYLKLLKVILARKSQLIGYKKLHLLLQKLLSKTISSNNRALLYEILTILNKQVMLDYFDQMLSTILPSQECEVRSKYVGIKNLGAICYINSILQQFFMVQKFRHLILNRSVPTDCMQIEVNGKPLIDNFMYQLQKMYQNLNNSQKKYYMPKDFCYSYKDFQGQPINTSIQQDSHEFLNRLLQNVQEACKKDGTLERLQQVYQIKTLSEYECGECKNRIDKIQNHYSCMLQVKEQDSLSNSLKKFNQKEEIQGYTCENCQKKVRKISKRTYLHELPQVVILNLQRIIFDQKKGDKIKVHSALTFPTQINFQQYMKHSNLSNMKTNYRLKGVVIHTGTSEGGHYYSLIRDSKSQKWYKFNDQSVTQFDEKEISREGFGGFQSKDNQFQEVTYSTNAYILFYESSDVKKLQYIQAQNNLSEQVQKENMRLIKQIQIHQQNFFAAINNLYERYRAKDIELRMKNDNFSQIKMVQNQQKLYEKLLIINQKAFSFLSVFSSVKNQIKAKISRNLQEMYFLLPEQSSKFFKQLNIGTFAQNLISHNDAIFRESLKHIFARNLFIFINYYGVDINQEREESFLIKKIIDHLIQLLTDSLLYSSFNKSIFYFSLFLDLIHYNQRLKYYLLKRQLMFKLLDLLMGRQSFYMKYHLKAQDLPNNIAFIILEIISKIVHHKRNMKSLQVKNQKITFYFETSNLEAKILMSSVFYRRIFRLNYNHHLLIPIIQHFSFQDFDYTVLICDIFLQQINKTDVFDLDLLFTQLQALLLVEDKLQHLRWCFLIGLPQYVQVRQNLFCLNTSDKSQNTLYVSGLYPNKQDKFTFQAQRKPLLQIIFCEKSFRKQNLILFGLSLLSTLAQASQALFLYLLEIPPPNYHKLTLFDLIPEIAEKLLEDQDFIIDKKADKISMISNLYQLLEQRLKITPKKLPIKKFIIGKNKDTEEVDKLQSQLLTCSLRKFNTYVLQNLPLGHQNISMPKTFSQARGIGSLFLDYRVSLSTNEDKIQGKNVKATVYVLKGKINHKAILRFSNQHFDYTFLLNQGQFNINMPYYKEGGISVFVKIDFYKEPHYQTNLQQLQTVFRIEQQEKPQAGNGKMIEEKNAIPEDKIQCPNCTLLNQLSSQKCQACQNPLFM